MADADRLTFTLSSGGDVVIKLRPDLAPGHVARITELANRAFTTASRSTASSRASWPRAATPPAPAWSGRTCPI